MCASYEAKFSVTQLVEAFAETGIGLVFPGGVPNLEPRDEVRPTDRAPAVRAVADQAQGPVAQGLTMGFGFPPPRPKAGPVINFRSEGRSFGNGPRGGRCLVPVSGFYEFTGDRYPKTRWKLAAADGAPVLMLAAVWRGDAGAEAGSGTFSLLTAEPGPDVAPYHTRGVLPLPPDAWADWLFNRRPAEDLLIPPPAGTLIALPAPRP
jgi:putative SOS response-associated peptidase YedK